MKAGRKHALLSVIRKPQKKEKSYLYQVIVWAQKQMGIKWSWINLGWHLEEGKTSFRKEFIRDVKGQFIQGVSKDQETTQNLKKDGGQ